MISAKTLCHPLIHELSPRRLPRHGGHSACGPRPCFKWAPLVTHAHTHTHTHTNKPTKKRPSNSPRNIQQLSSIGIFLSIVLIFRSIYLSIHWSIHPSIFLWCIHPSLFHAYSIDILSIYHPSLILPSVGFQPQLNRIAKKRPLLPLPAPSSLSTCLHLSPPVSSTSSGIETMENKVKGNRKQHTKQSHSIIGTSPNASSSSSSSATSSSLPSPASKKKRKRKRNTQKNNRHKKISIGQLMQSARATASSPRDLLRHVVVTSLRRCVVTRAMGPDWLRAGHPSQPSRQL